MKSAMFVGAMAVMAVMVLGFASEQQFAGAEKPVYVSITTWDGFLTSFEFYPSDTIANLKLKINSEKGVPVEKQLIYYYGRELQDSMTLADYDVGKSFGLYLVILK